MIGTANSGTCETSTPNRNACNFNLLAQTPSDLQTASIIPVSGAAPITNYAPIPSDPSIDPLSATTSTVCGNGIQETFEDCDFGASENGGIGRQLVRVRGRLRQGYRLHLFVGVPGQHLQPVLGDLPPRVPVM